MLKIHEMILHLDEMSLENFKCFNSKKNIKFNKITILTGANSSGKSSLLHAISGVVQSTEMPFKFSLNGKYTNMGDFNEIVYRHNPQSIVSLGFKFHSPEENFYYNLETKWKRNQINFLPEISSFSFYTDFFYLNVGDGFLNFSYNPSLDPKAKEAEMNDFVERSITSFQINSNFEKRNAKNRKPENQKKETEKFQKFLLTFFKKTSIKNLALGEIDNLAGLVKLLSKNRNLRLDYILNTVLSNFIGNFDLRFNLISSFRLYPNRTYLEASRDKAKVDKFGDGYLDQIMIWERKKDLRLKELEKILKDLKLVNTISSKRIGGGRYEMQLKINEKGVSSALADVGFGISQFLPILVADLQLPKSSTLMIAEPEIHLHPNVQSNFGAYLVEQVKTKDKRYILETHSEYLLNRLRLAVVKEEIAEDDISIYYLENNGNDTTIHDLKFTKTGQIKNAPRSFFDTYMMDLKDIALSVKI